MKDKLKRFVRDNHSAFDVNEPSDELWAKISQNLPNHNGKIVEEGKLGQIIFQNGGKRRLNNIFMHFGNWRVAAAIIVAFGLGYSAYRLNNKYQLTEQPEIVLTSPEMAKQVSQYTKLIENKRLELRKLTKSDPILYRQFANELDQLEMSYRNLKADLPKNPNQETLIEAMIQNLQWQINILNQQLQIIQKIKQSKSNEKHLQNIV